MKSLRFEISYVTAWGEHLAVFYAIDTAEPQVVLMQSADGAAWHVQLDSPDDAQGIRYAYRVVNEAGHTVRYELNSWRHFRFNHRGAVTFCDSWTEHQLPELYHRAAFSQSIMLPRGSDELHMEHLSAPCLLLLHALKPQPGHHWVAVGSTEAWGDWHPERGKRLQRTGTYEWALPLLPDDFIHGVDYKYVLFDEEHPERSVWESGDNRRLQALADTPAGCSMVRFDEPPHIALPLWRGAGVVMPVFSLRSRGSWGIGDFGDLRQFIHWAADTGLHAVQLLPINDTTTEGGWGDSYPYNSLSVYALHPVYLDPREWSKSKAFAQYADEAAQLNEAQELEYPDVFRVKMAFAHALFQEIGARTARTKDYKAFVADNLAWLEPYAEFCHGRMWQKDHSVLPPFQPAASQPHKATDKAFGTAHHDGGTAFYYFVQYLLHRQMLAAHTEAQQRGVLLKGDIPIGINPRSVPAWVDTPLFHFDGQAGAPPDDFAVKGQNWGFPTYNWERMAADGYRWWRERLGHMAHYFDAYRIDHVLGFFRIWEVPTHQHWGTMGHFRPALPLTESEVRGYGFTTPLAHCLAPFVSAQRMQALCADFGPAFATHYFVPDADFDGFRLRPGLTTQSAIAAQVSEEAVRECLMALATEVLFVSDPSSPDKVHPRVAAQLTHRFAELPQQERDAFNRLHDDFFYRRHNDFWAEQAMRRLPVITQSADLQAPRQRLCPLQHDGMLACAEDLGMVPSSVPPVLARLQILSLEIQRMPKAYGVRFGRPADYPYLSVATIATHDMAPLRLWWQQDAEQTQAFWRDALHQTGTAPDEATPEVCEMVVKEHLLSPSMLCLLALQDLLAISPSLRSRQPELEQINDPANAHHHWRYRMHITLEELIQATAFNEKLRGLIALSGR